MKKKKMTTCHAQKQNATTGITTYARGTFNLAQVYYTTVGCYLDNGISSSQTWFFFSSRRRHTRSLRDWSSDVCSSDLSLPSGLAAGVLAVAILAVGLL